MRDGRRTFNLRSDGSVDATMHVAVCGQLAVIHASMEVETMVRNEGRVRRIVRSPSQSDAIRLANEILDEKLAALKLALGEAA